MSSRSISTSRLPVRLVAAGVLAGSALLGSCRTPGSLCEEWRQTVISTGLACTALSEEDLDALTQPFDPMNVTRRGCGIVSSVSEPDEIVNDCFPVLNNLADQCAAGAIEPEYAPFVEEFPENLPAACAVGHFQIQR
jgi:hypothetical protein